MDYYFEDRHHLLDDQMPLSIYRNVNFSFRAHWHQEFELLFVESGSMLISINDDRRKLVAGEFALSKSGDIHYYETTMEDSQCILLVFKPEYFGFEHNWPNGLEFSSPYVANGMIGQEQVRRIHQLLLDVMSEKLAKDGYYETMVRSRITELCVVLLRSVPTVDYFKSGGEYSTLCLIRDVLEYIEEHYTENITLKSLSVEFNVDFYNLSKKFNRLTGNHLKSHIHELQISKAQQLLLSTDLTCIEVAMACGFESVRTFNRTFMKIKQATPSSIRH